MKIPQEKWAIISATTSKLNTRRVALIANWGSQERDKITHITVAKHDGRGRTKTYTITPGDLSTYKLINPINITTDMLNNTDDFWRGVIREIIKGHKKVLPEGKEVEIGEYLELMYKNNYIRKVITDIDEIF